VRFEQLLNRNHFLRGLIAEYAPAHPKVIIFFQYKPYWEYKSDDIYNFTLAELFALPNIKSIQMKTVFSSAPLSVRDWFTGNQDNTRGPRYPMTLTALAAFLFLFMISCKPSSTADTQANSETDTTIVANQYILTPFSASKEFPDASLKAMAYVGGTVSTVIGGTTYKLGEQTPDAPAKQCANSAEGQHLHLIVDTEPYIAKYESSFAVDIPDGDHYVLAFLSRSYHESIKTPDAYKAAKVTVADKGFTSAENIEGPMLFYSRPKGLYTGDDTKKVMLDFYLVNADLGEYTVEADINGEIHLLDSWVPYYIEGLPEGDNTIKLTLLDQDGKPADVPLNPVTRTFKLEKTPVAN